MTVYLYIPIDQAQDVLTWGRHIRATTTQGTELLDAEQGTIGWVVTGSKPSESLREVVSDGDRRYLPAFVFCEVDPGDVGPDHQHACTTWPTWPHEDKTWAIASVVIPADRATPLIPLPFVEPVPVTIVPVTDSTHIVRWQVTAPVVDGIDTLETSRQIAEKTVENHQKSLNADCFSLGKHQPWAKTRALWLLSAITAKVGPWALMRLSEYDMNYWFIAIGAEPMPNSGGAMQPRRCWRLGGLSGLELCGHPVGTNCSEVGCLKTGAMTQDELLAAQGFQQLRRKPLTVSDPRIVGAPVAAALAESAAVPLQPFTASAVAEMPDSLQAHVDHILEGLTERERQVLAERFPAARVQAIRDEAVIDTMESPPIQHYRKAGAAPDEWKRVNRAIDVDKLRLAIGERASSLAKVAADVAIHPRSVGSVSAVGGEVKSLLWVLEQIAKMTEER